MSSPLPAHLPPPDSDADLDARILHVEQRLIAREERLHRGAGALAGELRERLQPRRLLWPAAGAVVAGAALLSLLRRPQAVAPAPTPRAAARPGLDIPWVRLLGLAWPLLPERWRERVSPATASTVVTLGLPLVEALLDGGRETPPLTTMAEVDLARLAGRWFMVGELPAPLLAEAVQPPELGLLPREDGQFELLQRRIDARGTHGSEARIEPVPGSQGARLRISHWPEMLHWLPWAWTELAVLHVDAGYDEAVLGNPARSSLWLLSRRPAALAPERRHVLAQLARERGYPAERLRFFEAAAAG